MSYLFWFVFFSIMAYMVWQAVADKRAYQRDQAKNTHANSVGTAHTKTPHAAHD